MINRIRYSAAVSAAMKLYPNLTVHGLYSQGNNDWAGYEDAFQLCLDVLDLLPSQQSITPHSPGSYNLKHDAEYLGKVRGKETYVPNGVMIAALVYRGIKTKALGPNVFAAIHAASRRKLFDRLRNNKLPPALSGLWKGSTVRAKTKAIVALCDDLKITCGEFTSASPDWVDPAFVFPNRLSASGEANILSRFAELREKIGCPDQIRFFEGNDIRVVKI